MSRGLGFTPPEGSPKRKGLGVFTEPQCLFTGTRPHSVHPQRAPGPAPLIYSHEVQQVTSPSARAGQAKDTSRRLQKSHRGKEGGEKGGGLHSLLLLPGGDGDQLLGCLGDVIGTLDDLLGQELVVHGGARLRGHGLAALALQAVGTGIQQPQGAAYWLQGWLLQGEKESPDKRPVIGGSETLAHPCPNFC